MGEVSVINFSFCFSSIRWLGQQIIRTLVSKNTHMLLLRVCAHRIVLVGDVNLIKHTCICGETIYHHVNGL